MPGEYIVSYPFIARAPPSGPRPCTQPNEESGQRRDSVDSLDSIAREKEEAQIVQTSRSGLRSAFSKVASRLSGAGKEKAADVGEGKEGEARKHAPSKVEAEGGRKREDSGRQARKLELTDAEKERIEMAKNSCKMPRDVWFDAGEASDARLMRRTS